LQDCDGHGTHVAGIVKAVAPDAIIGAYRIFSCTGYSDADVIMAALEQSVSDGMDIINMYD
jgi:subtilisin family serine protease